MKPLWRLLDTGVLTGARNMALDQALLRTRARSASPNTVRLLMFDPPVALVGAFQQIENEIRVEYCHEAGIDINRRITGGGGILFDRMQLGWELIAGSLDFGIHPMTQLFQRRVCEACILGLRNLGVNAAFRPRNDIEVHGRKISGTGGVEEGDAFLFQGTLLLDFDVATMLRALRVPTEKLKHSELASAADRVTWLKRELGVLPSIEMIKAAIAHGFQQVFNVDLEPGPLWPEEDDLYQELVPFMESDDWVYRERRRPSSLNAVKGTHCADTAVIHAHLSVDDKGRRVRSALLTGDMLISPRRVIPDLEARLKDMPLDHDRIHEAIRDFWKKAQPNTSGFGADDVFAAVENALFQLEWGELGFNSEERAKIITVGGSPRGIMRRKIDLVLLPYCAKIPECGYRKQEDCIVCGLCAFGDVYSAAQQAGFRPLAITSFEHLQKTLRRERESGGEGFIGACCRQFYTKHFRDFEESGLSGVLVDLCNSTCYDLEKENDAYRGDFEGYTEMDADLMLKLIEALKSARECAATDLPGASK